MTFDSFIGELMAAGIGVVIAAQYWMFREVHKLNVLLGERTSKYDLLHGQYEDQRKRHDREIERLETRLIALEQRN